MPGWENVHSISEKLNSDHYIQNKFNKAARLPKYPRIILQTFETPYWLLTDS